MTEIVERVARAISAAFREEGSFWDGAWESDAEQAAFHESAGAAMAAMREPSEAMEAAGAAAEGGCEPEPECDHETVLRPGLIWQAMIAAALGERQ